MDKKLEDIVAVKVLETQKHSAEVTAQALCQKVVDAKVAYETALQEYSVVVAKIEGFDEEIKNYDKA